MLLATSRALLRKGNRELHPVRLLIDHGSELSFITEDVVQRAQLTRRAASIPLLGIGGTYSGRTKGSVSIQLKSIQDSASHCQIRAFVLPRLTAKLPSFSVSSPSWPHISGLQLANPDYSISGPIQVIIDSDNYHAVIRPGLIPGDSSSPTAQQTIFGWSSVALFQQQIHLFPRTRIIVRRITTYKTLFQDSGHRRNSLIPPEQG
ncbi:unnamed protein product [Lasius platythorax]|uniref:Peptidase A2 domain-containing protein n=1 Tax=Lasius platythorax TaxID=488582 RepID=A0AAV2MXE0_9HYME